MKATYFLLAAVLLFAFGCESEDVLIEDTNIATEEIEIEESESEEPESAGGFIFYDAGNYDNGWRYIEAAPVDLEGFEWGCHRTPILDARSLEVGAGLSNTLAIVEFHDSLTNYYSDPDVCSDESDGTVAAKGCLDLEVNGFDDWHLPSSGEMLLMYEALHLEGIGDFDESVLYWSSTEHDEFTAISTDFSTGQQGYLCKPCSGFGLAKVRAVRYF